MLTTSRKTIGPAYLRPRRTAAREVQERWRRPIVATVIEENVVDKTVLKTPTNRMTLPEGDQGQSD